MLAQLTLEAEYPAAFEEHSPEGLLTALSAGISSRRSFAALVSAGFAV